MVPPDRATGAIEYTASVASPSPSPLPGPAPGFADVPPGYWAHNPIGSFARRGITTGCDIGTYCPDRFVTRAEMAVFLDRTLGYGSPAARSAQRFTDGPQATGRNFHRPVRPARHHDGPWPGGRGLETTVVIEGGHHERQQIAHAVDLRMIERIVSWLTP